jgi:hypothetical protein
MSALAAIVRSMASKALTRWHGARAARLDDLDASHRLVRIPSRGRLRRGTALNDARILRLAAEFQGFTRDLHDEACEVFAQWSAPMNEHASGLIQEGLCLSRDVDRGNAHPGSLGKDFSRFGIDLWARMKIRDPLTPSHSGSLDQLNRARNAIAHADSNKLARLRSSGIPLVASTIRRWRHDLDALAVNMDREVGVQLGLIFGRSSPW